MNPVHPSGSGKYGPAECDINHFDLTVDQIGKMAFQHVFILHIYDEFLEASF